MGSLNTLYIITTEQCQMSCPFCYCKFVPQFKDFKKNYSNSTINKDKVNKVLSGKIKDANDNPIKLCTPNNSKFTERGICAFIVIIFKHKMNKINICFFIFYSAIFLITIPVYPSLSLSV